MSELTTAVATSGSERAPSSERDINPEDITAIVCQPTHDVFKTPTYGGEVQIGVIVDIDNGQVVWTTGYGTHDDMYKLEKSNRTVGKLGVPIVVKGQEFFVRAMYVQRDTRCPISEYPHRISLIVYGDNPDAFRDAEPVFNAMFDCSAVCLNGDEETTPLDTRGNKANFLYSHPRHTTHR